MKFHVSFLRICQFLCIFAFFLLLTHSDLVLLYAREGIHSWAVSALPVLLPFIILSRLWIYYDVPSLLFKGANKIFPGHPALALSITVFFLGLSSGFPIGAVFIKYFYDRKFLTKEAAETLLPLCSFVSPMFLTGYVRTLTGYSHMLWYLFCIALYLPLLLCFISNIRSDKIQRISPGDFKQSIFSAHPVTTSGIQDIWLSSLEIIFIIGIYMMLFSILFGLAIHLPYLDYPFWKIILANLEITAGIQWIAKMPEIEGILRGMILAASVSLGGLCTMAQVYTIISESDLSLKPYIKTKSKTAVLSAALLLLFFLLFKVFFAAGSSGSIS